MSERRTPQKDLKSSKPQETVTHDEFLAANAQALAVFAHLEREKNTNSVKKAKTVATVEKKNPEPLMDGDTPKMKQDGTPMMTKESATVLFNDGTKERFRVDNPLYVKAVELSPGASVMMHGRLMPFAESRSGNFGDYAVTEERVIWDDITVIFDPSKYSPVGVA